jgi:hypothetical protein
LVKKKKCFIGIHMIGLKANNRILNLNPKQKKVFYWYSYDRSKPKLILQVKGARNNARVEWIMQVLVKFLHLMHNVISNCPIMFRD